jgi:diguanylate cyclase (GGDEF)-like protein
VVWAGYLFAFPWLSEHLGQYARMIGLVPVAVFGWAWGVFAGVGAGILGLLAIEFRSGNLAPGEWLVTYTFPSERVFELLTFAGTGLAVGFLQRFRQTINVERAVSQRAQVDPLTGALSRGAFDERLQATITRLTDSSQGLAVLFVDLDRFKFVNDTYGHEMGDRLLGEVGRVLRENIRDNDFVGRVGGDEFTVALLGVKEERSAASIARGLVRELSAPFTIDGRDVQVSASIGIGLYPRDGHDPETLLKSADAAMYQVKEGGKNSFYFSTVEVRTRLSRRLELERQLRTALQEHQLEVAYQPQVHLADNKLAGFEALLRWQSPELGTVSPGEFIPVAEDAGLITPIGHWMLRETALQQREWLRAGLQPVRIAVNVSTMQFHQQSFLDTVKGALNDSGIPPELLEIEVTESVLVRDYELAMRTLHKLDKLGVPTALDDFGTGYSSLAYLQRLPIRTLKIDRSFVQGLSPRPVDVALHPNSASTRASTFNTDGHGLVKRSGSAWSEIASGINTATVDQASTLPIVEAICAMAHKLGKQVVAEGIETAYQRDFLRRLGVDLAQGYFFARPMKPADAEQLLRRVTRENETAKRLSKDLPTVAERDPFSSVVTNMIPTREFDELLLHD